MSDRIEEGRHTAWAERASETVSTERSLQLARTLSEGSGRDGSGRDTVGTWLLRDLVALVDEGRSAAGERDALAEHVARLEAQVEDWRATLSKIGWMPDHTSGIDAVTLMRSAARAGVARYPQIAPSDPVRVPEDSGEARS